MRTFPQLLVAIRKEARVTQKQLAEALGVSTILISMVEVGQSQPSKKLVERLAVVLDVHPMTISPFLFGEDFEPNKFEAFFVRAAEKLQDRLIEKRAEYVWAFVKTINDN